MEDSDIPPDAPKAAVKLPACGDSKPCANADCPWPNFEQGYGLAGGGMGVYEFCSVCGQIVSKTITGDF